MKKKTYCYENRTFEVKVYNELAGYMLGIYVNEVIRPNRKFFGRTKHFYFNHVFLDEYASIDDTVKSVIAEGLEIEVYNKTIDEKWKGWGEE